MFPFTRVPFWVPFFDPQPFVACISALTFGRSAFPGDLGQVVDVPVPQLHEDLVVTPVIVQKAAGCGGWSIRIERSKPWLTQPVPKARTPPHGDSLMLV